MAATILEYSDGKFVIHKRSFEDINDRGTDETCLISIRNNTRGPIWAAYMDLSCEHLHECAPPMFDTRIHPGETRRRWLRFHAGKCISRRQCIDENAVDLATEKSPVYEWRQTLDDRTFKYSYRLGLFTHDPYEGSFVDWRLAFHMAKINGRMMVPEDTPPDFCLQYSLSNDAGSIKMQSQ
jgi:hypothetical protein